MCMSMSLACFHLLQAVRQCMVLPGSDGTSRQRMAQMGSGWHCKAAMALPGSDGTSRQQMALQGSNAISRQRWHYPAVYGIARQYMAQPGSTWHWQAKIGTTGQ